MKHKRYIIFALSLVLSAAVFTGCGSGGSYSNSTAMNAASSTAAAPSTAQYADSEEDAYDYLTGESTIDEEKGVAFSSTQETSVAASNRMIITTVTLQMQTQEFDKGIAEIDAIVANHGGFVQDSNIDGMGMYEKYASRNASFTVRIPSDRLDAFIGGVGDTFHIINKQQSGQDITESYHDNEARLNSLRVQEKRLLEMMETAEELQYLIEVQRELADVQYQIDSYTSSKLRMENQVSMSTVYLYLNEVMEYDPVEPVPVTFGERLRHTASNSFASFVSFLQDFVLAVIWLAPFLIFLAILVGIVVIIIMLATRKSRRLNKQRKQVREHQLAQAVQVQEPTGEIRAEEEPASESDSNE